MEKELVDSLHRFEAAFVKNEISLHPCECDKNLFFNANENGEQFAYAKIVDGEVGALVTFARTTDHKGELCYQVGYAVKEKFRKQGLAKSTLASAIKEFEKGVKEYGITPLYIKAIVYEYNTISQKIASHCISSSPEKIMDPKRMLWCFEYLLPIV